MLNVLHLKSFSVEISKMYGLDFSVAISLSRFHSEWLFCVKFTLKQHEFTSSEFSVGSY